MEQRVSGIVPHLGTTHLLIAQAARPAPASVVDSAPAAADLHNDPGTDTGPRSGGQPGTRTGPRTSADQDGQAGLQAGAQSAQSGTQTGAQMSGHVAAQIGAATPWAQPMKPPATETWMQASTQPAGLPAVAQAADAPSLTEPERDPVTRPRIEPPPDPDQPTGPPPTFKANLLEVEAARRRAALPTAAAEARRAAEETPQPEWPRFDADMQPVVDVTR